MKKILPKSPRLKLDRKYYSKLHQQVLERDNWRCQACGSMQNLEVHHIQFRSHSGLDSEENLITLCDGCHRACHIRSPVTGPDSSEAAAGLRRTPTETHD